MNLFQSCSNPSSYLKILDSSSKVPNVVPLTHSSTRTLVPQSNEYIISFLQLEVEIGFLYLDSSCILTRYSNNYQRINRVIRRIFKVLHSAAPEYFNPFCRCTILSQESRKLSLNHNLSTWAIIRANPPHLKMHQVTATLHQYLKYR